MSRSLATSPSSKPRRASTTSVLFFFNDPTTTWIYTLSLHDALPILDVFTSNPEQAKLFNRTEQLRDPSHVRLNKDRKSTRLNSSHVSISYAVFCLKKKTIQQLSPTGNTPKTVAITIAEAGSLNREHF